jgi:hypothetical protein
MRIFLVFITLSFYSGVLQAGAEGYVCKVAARTHLTDTGTLSSDPKSEWIGDVFTVDRKSGKIIGTSIKSDDYKTEVIDVGSSKWSFKAIGKTGDMFGTLVMYLEVWEHRKGSPKPFILVDSVVMYSGTCV